MKTITVFTAFAAAASVFASQSSIEELVPRTSSKPLTSITVNGNAFVQGSNRFYIRGVDYQPGGSSNLIDPIADEASCMRDIPEFTKLGINTIRVYTVDNTASHDACMSALAEAGIYLVLDVNTPLYSINRDDPAASYNAVYLQNVFATIDAFADYTNVLAFFSGNEVVNDDTTTAAAPYVKAVTRDMMQYIGDRGYRQIPVGYSAADVDSNRMEMAEYMNCGSNNERSDFFAFNDYSWCDPSSFTTSGWDQKVKNFTGYGIPIFLSEYGCITNLRTFQETGALYNTEMTSVYSGGLVYEYSEEGNGYGLVIIDGDSVNETAQFTYLKTAFASVSDPPGDGGYSTTGGASTCPPASPTWNVTGDALPAMPAAAATYMKTGAGSGAGLTGPGSQNATSATAVGSAFVSIIAGGSTATKKSAAVSIHTSLDETPLIVELMVVSFTFLGAVLLQ